MVLLASPAEHRVPVRETLDEVLRGVGYATVTAKNGREGLDVLAQHRAQACVVRSACAA